MARKSNMRLLMEAKIHKMAYGINCDMRISEGVPIDKPLPKGMKEIDYTDFLTTSSDEEVLLLFIGLMRPWQKAQL